MMVERRREPRVPIKMLLCVWGEDANGIRFTQEAFALDISQSGALLSITENTPRCGDLIGIAYEGRKARYRVVWVCKAEGQQQIKVAAQKLAGDECPWLAMLARPAHCVAAPKPAAKIWT